MPTNPAQLPESVAELLDRTLGEGGEPGVLADWLDEHSNYWEGFAAALRQSTAPDKLPPFRTFEYQVVCPGIMFWRCEGSIWAAKGQPKTSVMLLGVYRAAPFAPGMWRRVVSPEQLPKSVLRRLGDAFDVSNWVENV